MRTLLLLLTALTSTACLRTTSFHCTDDTSCGTGGAFETTGYCSFSDPDCASGRRYGDASGSLANTCTGGGGPDADADTTIDTPTATDAAVDTPTAQCPNGYAAIANGETGHQYMVLSSADDWNAQEAACQATTVKAHLAVPADETEHAAIDTLAGASTYWIGIVKNGAGWDSVFGGAQTYLPWEGGAPSNSAQEQMVYSLSASHTIYNDKSVTNRPAVCECAP
jgi:hypothetical protein